MRSGLFGCGVVFGCILSALSGCTRAPAAPSATANPSATAAATPWEGGCAILRRVQPGARGPARRQPARGHRGARSDP